MYDSNQLDSFRYAQMQSSILNKTGLSNSSSASKVNLKNKFSTIESTLITIDSDLRNLITDTHESKRFTKQLSNDVVDRQLNENKSKLMEEIKKLDKTVKYGITEGQKRSERIWNDCKNRIKATEGLKNQMNILRERITKLQNTLGYHSVCEKVI